MKVRKDGVVEDQPITAASLPLPAGASTLSEQQAQTALLGTIDADTSVLSAVDFATETTLASILADTANIDTNITSILADTANIDTNIAAILADTANIDTNVASILSDTSSIDGKLPASLGQTTAINSLAVVLASDQSVIPVGDNGGSLTVDGTIAATQSGTWNINDISGTISLPTGAATLLEQQSQTALLGTIDADTSALAGTVSGSELQVDVVTSALPTGAATAANQLPDGHNVTVDNASGASAVNIQDGGNSITVDDGAGSLTVDGTVTANQGGSPWQVEGELTTGSAISGTNPILIGAQNVSGNLQVPTLINASGTNIWGTAIVDTSANVTVVSNQALQITGDEAHDAADAGNPIKTGGRAETDPDGPTAVADGDRVQSWYDTEGRQHIKNHPHTDSSQLLTSLDDTFDNTTTSVNSGDISVGFYRFAMLSFNVVSANTPTRIVWTLQYKDTAGNYNDFGQGFWARLVFDDVSTSTEIDRCFVFDVVPNTTMRIVITATGTDASNTFTTDDHELWMWT
jgi:hypothetical protein